MFDTVRNGCQYKVQAPLRCQRSLRPVCTFINHHHGRLRRDTTDSPTKAPGLGGREETSRRTSTGHRRSVSFALTVNRNRFFRFSSRFSLSTRSAQTSDYCSWPSLFFSLVNIIFIVLPYTVFIVYKIYARLRRV